MKKPSVIRVFFKDLIDFSMVITVTLAITLGIYSLVPSFNHVDLSLYFFEQFIELFFSNPPLILWFLGLGLGVTIFYFLLCTMLWQTTLGGVLVGIDVIDKTSKKPLKFHQALLMALGAYFGVIAFMLSPLFAWWLDGEHRGFSEKLSFALLVKK